MISKFDEPLAECSREPIHIPGAIQPFGVLFALDELLHITRCSQNTTAVLGLEAEAVLGRSVEELLGCDLVPFVSANDFRATRPFRLRMPGDGASFDAFLHRHRGQLILELEFATNHDNEEENPAGGNWIQTALATIESSTSVVTLCQHACEHVKQLTGLDGVMVYKFHDDDHGEVIAESKDDRWPRYLGLHYPASDIPPQARAVFLDNWVRMIPERDYIPAPLVSHCAAAAPLDLGRSMLRSVSPVHIEYLRNMGVRASLTLSLISEGRLWGLIAGHHYRGPKHVAYQTRAAAELVARLVSQQLRSREELEIVGHRERGRRFLTEVVQKVREGSEITNGLIEQQRNIRDLLKCGGAAVALSGGHWKMLGDTPAFEQLVDLATWLDQRPGDWQVFHTDELAREHPRAAEYKACASGLLALRIPKGRSNYVLWFKPEVIRTITWAGDPNKPQAPQSSAARLRPRASFDEWAQTVTMKSLPWLKWEVELVEALGHALVSIDLQRQFDRAIEARAAAEWANEQKEQLLAMVSHDLKNPLHSLIVGVTFIQKMVPPESLTKLQSVLQAMRRSLQSMRHLIDDLLSIAKLESGTVDVEIQERSADSLMADAFDLLLPIAVEKGVQLQMAADSVQDCRVACDRERVLQVLSNLIGNAVKFTPPGGRITCRLDKTARELIFSIADTGPGIAAENLSYIFDRFWQARQTRRLGSGLGLSIAQGLVTKQGGRIWVESRLGAGSTFYFTLPLMREGLCGSE